MSLTEVPALLMLGLLELRLEGVGGLLMFGALGLLLETELLLLEVFGPLLPGALMLPRSAATRRGVSAAPELLAAAEAETLRSASTVGPEASVGDELGGGERLESSGARCSGLARTCGCPCVGLPSGVESDTSSSLCCGSWSSGADPDAEAEADASSGSNSDSVPDSFSGRTRWRTPLLILRNSTLPISQCLLADLQPLHTGLRRFPWDVFVNARM